MEPVDWKTRVKYASCDELRNSDFGGNEAARRDCQAELARREAAGLPLTAVGELAADCAWEDHGYVDGAHEKSAEQRVADAFAECVQNHGLVESDRVEFASWYQDAWDRLDDCEPSDDELDLNGEAHAWRVDRDELELEAGRWR